MGSMPSARTHSTTAGLKMESRSKMRYLGAVSYGNASRSEKIGTPGRIRTLLRQGSGCGTVGAHLDTARTYLRAIAHPFCNLRLRVAGPVCAEFPRGEKLARPVGFEPTTYRFEVWRSIQLSYGRT